MSRSGKVTILPLFVVFLGPWVMHVVCDYEGWFCKAHTAPLAFAVSSSLLGNKDEIIEWTWMSEVHLKTYLEGRSLAFKYHMWKIVSKNCNH